MAAAPKFPDPRSNKAVIAYLVEWAKIVIPASPGLEELLKRLPDAERQPTPQAAVARAIYLGPPATAPGAARWLKIATALQAYLQKQIGEKPIASTLGGALADAASTVAKAASSAGGAAAAAVKSTAEAAAQAVVPTAGTNVPSVQAEEPGFFAKIADKVGGMFPSLSAPLKGWVSAMTAPLALVGGGIVSAVVIPIVLPGIIGIFVFNKLIPFIPAIVKALK